MKKTLYYKSIVKVRDLMVSDGFIIAEIKDNELIRLEGVFSYDYLITEFIGDRKFLSYFSKRNAVGEYERNWTIELSDIELPLNVQTFVDAEYQENIVTAIAEILTVDKILSKNEKMKCDKQMLEVKNNVFGKERN